MVWHSFWLYLYCDLDLEDMTLGQGHVTTLGEGKQWCKYYLYQTWQWGVRAQTLFLGMYTLRRVILSSHIMNLSQVQVNLHRSWPTDRCYWHRLGYVYSMTLTLDITLGRGQDTPLDHGQQLYEILSISNNAVKSYSQDTDIEYMYLDLGNMTLYFSILLIW